MADVHVLPGVERRDIGEKVESSKVLEAAIENGVFDAIVVGRSRDGNLYIASENADIDATVGKLMRVVSFLASGQLENE